MIDRYRALISPSFTSFGTDPALRPTIEVTMHPTSGLLAWTPSKAGDYFVTLIATDPHDEYAMQSFFVTATAPC